MYQCLNCRACEAVCPSGVHYGPLVEASRAQLEQHRPRPLWQRGLRKVALGWLFGDAARLRRMTGGLRLYQRSGLAWVARRSGILKLIGMAETIYGLILILCIIFLPSGIYGSARDALRRRGAAPAASGVAGGSASRA